MEILNNNHMAAFEPAHAGQKRIYRAATLGHSIYARTFYRGFYAPGVSRLGHDEVVRHRRLTVLPVPRVFGWQHAPT